MAGNIRLTLPLAFCGIVALAAFSVHLLAEGSRGARRLPEPTRKGKVSLEEVLAKRRSVRRFEDRRLSQEQIAQLCWAAQGITEPKRGLRTCPSAGALYPLEIYVVTGDGAYHYLPHKHAMEEHLAGDLRRKLQRAALGQPWVGQAPATVVIAAAIGRTERKYGRRAERYVHIEVGHAGQNILLQAQALGLGAVPVGAFRDAEVSKTLSLGEGLAPVYLIPVGIPAGGGR